MPETVDFNARETHYYMLTHRTVNLTFSVNKDVVVEDSYTIDDLFIRIQCVMSVHIILFKC